MSAGGVLLPGRAERGVQAAGSVALFAEKVLRAPVADGSMQEKDINQNHPGWGPAKTSTGIKIT